MMKADGSLHRQVRFDTVTVTLFPMILGDNPACSDGAPVQMASRPLGSSTTHQIELYEYFRSEDQEAAQRRRRRRSKTGSASPSGNTCGSGGRKSKKKKSPSSSSSNSTFNLSVQQRAAILFRAGYTIEDIAGATQEVQRVKRERAESFDSSSDKWMQLLQKTGKVPLYIVQGVLVTAGKTVSTVIRTTGAVAVAGGNALKISGPPLKSSTSFVEDRGSSPGNCNSADTDNNYCAQDNGHRSRQKTLQARSA